MKKEQKKQSVQTNVDPKTISESGDIIVCAKLGASMQKYITMHILNALQEDLVHVRDAAMLIVDPSPDNAKMIVQMLYDQFAKTMYDFITGFDVSQFVDKDAKCPMDALVFENND